MLPRHRVRIQERRIRHRFPAQWIIQEKEVVLFAYIISGRSLEPIDVTPSDVNSPARSCSISSDSGLNDQAPIVHRQDLKERLIEAMGPHTCDPSDPNPTFTSLTADDSLFLPVPTCDRAAFKSIVTGHCMCVANSHTQSICLIWFLHRLLLAAYRREPATPYEFHQPRTTGTPDSLTARHHRCKRPAGG